MSITTTHTKLICENGHDGPFEMHEHGVRVTYDVLGTYDGAIQVLERSATNPHRSFHCCFNVDGYECWSEIDDNCWTGEIEYVAW